MKLSSKIESKGHDLNSKFKIASSVFKTYKKA